MAAIVPDPLARPIQEPAAKSDNDAPSDTSVHCRSLWVALVWLTGVAWVGGCAGLVPVSGLRPEYPEARVTFVEVDSLLPTFRWEVFPRPQDREADSEGLLRRIRNVTYDLKIWRAEDNYPVEEVYSRQGLPERIHRIEEPLEPSTKFFWTVRARFDLDGQPRVTQWGVTILGVAVDPARLPLVPNPFYYRFRTPPS